MSKEFAFDKNLDRLRDRAASARDRVERARTSQERSHLEGMASYWEEILLDALHELEAKSERAA
jgi:hypothetical protein